MSFARRGVGFRPTHSRIHDIYNRSIAVLALVTFSPLLLVISAALFATQGREIFYRGPRLGRDGTVFHIFKFRTLETEAAKRITRDRVLPAGTNIETPLGRLLRINRLDELPQLLNIARGDMVLCGPRPVRPEIAEIARGHVDSYDRRFSVKPGLVGPAQAYSSHGACKKIRARIENAMIGRPVSYVAEWRLLATIGASVLGMVVGDVAAAVGLETTKKRNRSHHGAGKDIWLEFPDRPGLTLAVDAIGPDTLRLSREFALASEGDAVLCMTLRRGGVRRARIALAASEKADLLNYVATSAAGQFTVERYALNLAVVSPALKARKLPAKTSPVYVLPPDAAAPT